MSEQQATTAHQQATEFDYSQYNLDQCKEIKKHRWIESEKVGYDLGSIAERDWISKWARAFREDAMRTGRYKKKVC